MADITQAEKLLVEQLATKYLDKLGTNPSFNERDFVLNIQKWMNTPNFRWTDGRKNCIQKLVDKHINGAGKPSTPAPAQQPIENGRFCLYREDAGWQVYIDKRRFGKPVDYRTGKAVIDWMDDGVLEAIEEIALGGKEQEGGSSDPF